MKWKILITILTFSISAWSSRKKAKPAPVNTIALSTISLFTEKKGNFPPKKDWKKRAAHIFAFLKNMGATPKSLLLIKMSGTPRLLAILGLALWNGAQKSAPLQHIAYPCSHFYFKINFRDRLYSKEKRRAWPLLFWIRSVAKFFSEFLLWWARSRCLFFLRVFRPAV